MRELILKELLAKNGASFRERYGVSVPATFSGVGGEYSFVRDGVGISDFSHMQKFRISAEAGIDFLDNIFVGNVAKIRFCRVLHSSLVSPQGDVMADCYIANNDEDYIVLCESIIDDATLKDVFDKNGAAQAGLEDLTSSHVLLAIDGYKAWAVVKELFGADVLGLPYLSIETYPFGEGKVSLFRCGKTSEFGYMIMAPRELAASLFEKLLSSAKKYDGGLCGADAHDVLRLEGRFFNIFAEGLRVKDPLTLGLQWMIDFDKEVFIGREAIMERRAKGLSKKIIGIKTIGDNPALMPGADIFCGGEKVGVVEASGFSHVLDSRLGLGLFNIDFAYAGLKFNLGSKGGCEIETISMPPIVPKSLSVKLDEL